MVETTGTTNPELTNEGCNSAHFQRALDLEAFGYMGITPDQKYQREVGVVFDDDKGGFAKALPEDAKILDLACGSGYTTALMKNIGQGYQIDAMDLSPTAIRNAQEKYGDKGINFQVGDMKNPNAANPPYNAITCLGRSLAYFETYEEYIEALKNWNNLLEEGGKVAVEWTEWSDVINPDTKFQSINGVSVKDGEIWDDNAGDGLKFSKATISKFEYPGKQLSHQINKDNGYRIYVDKEGKEHPMGSQKDLFVDLLKTQNFPLLKRMFEEVGFTNIQLIEDPNPLTPPGNPRECKVYTITAEKPISSHAGFIGKMRRFLHPVIG